MHLYQTGQEAIEGCNALLTSEETLLSSYECAVIYYNRGLLYDEQGDYEQALKDFDEALILHSTFLPTLLGRRNA